MGKQVISKQVNIKNKKASFEYRFLDKYVAGIVLSGSEIKSIRQTKANLQDAYCYFKGKELFVKGMHVSPYSEANIQNHETKRDRKLLLKKRELKKLKSKSDEGGYTIVPIRLFITEKGLAKLEISLAKGKNLYDRREDIKEKDLKREMDRIKH